MARKLIKVVLMSLGMAVGSGMVQAEPLDNTKAWSQRMVESEMVRFPEAWMMDWDEKPTWDYVHGLNLLGFTRVYEQTGDQRYFDYLKGYYDTLIDDKGNIATYKKEKFNIDMINAGKVLFFLYDQTGDKKYLLAADKLRAQFDEHPRTIEGGFWHKKRYPYQMWLDGLYMGAPFYAEYIMRAGKPEQLDDVFLQFELIEKHLYDPKTGLPRHGWDESRDQKWADNSTGLSPHHWSRALGWYAMAMADVLDIVPPHLSKRAWLASRFENLMTQVVKYQHTSGTWYQVTDLGDRDGNYLEASGTAMLTYAMAKGVNLGVLPAEFKGYAEKGFAGLLDQMISVDPESNVITLEKVCAVAGLGGNPYRDGSFEYYMSEPIRPNDAKGVGPFILAAVELGK